EVLRVAVDANSTAGVAAVAVLGGRPFGVMHHPKIQLAIAVVIEPAGRHRPLTARDAGLRGDVFEPAVSRIAIEYVSVYPGHEKIGMPVIVEVPHGRPHGV